MNNNLCGFVVQFSGLMKRLSISRLYKRLTHFMIAVYCITQNMLKSSAVLSCFRITKMEGNPR